MLEDRDATILKWSKVKRGKYLDEWHDTNYVSWFSGYLKEIDTVLTKSGFKTNLQYDIGEINGRA